VWRWSARVRATVSLCALTIRRAGRVPLLPGELAGQCAASMLCRARENVTMVKIRMPFGFVKFHRNLPLACACGREVSWLTATLGPW